MSVSYKQTLDAEKRAADAAAARPRPKRKLVRSGSSLVMRRPSWATIRPASRGSTRMARLGGRYAGETEDLPAALTKEEIAASPTDPNPAYEIDENNNINPVGTGAGQSINVMTGRRRRARRWPLQQGLKEGTPEYQTLLCSPATSPRKRR